MFRGFRTLELHWIFREVLRRKHGGPSAKWPNRLIADVVVKLISIKKFEK